MLGGRHLPVATRPKNVPVIRIETEFLPDRSVRAPLKLPDLIASGLKLYAGGDVATRDAAGGQLVVHHEGVNRFPVRGHAEADREAGADRAGVLGVVSLPAADLGAERDLAGVARRGARDATGRGDDERARDPRRFGEPVIVIESPWPSVSFPLNLWPRLDLRLALAEHKVRAADCSQRSSPRP